VRGSTSDNGVVQDVFVNGTLAESKSSNFAEWKATVPVSSAKSKDGLSLRAHAVDEARNTEPHRHVVKVIHP
jgi:hypothetical protein